MIKTNSTPPKYRQQLIYGATVKTLEVPPLEWKDGEFQFLRDLDKGGIFTNYNVSSLTFIKDGRKVLNDLFDESLSEAECFFQESWFNPTTNLYVDFPSTFKIDFSTWSEVETSTSGLGVSVGVHEVGILSKFRNRKGTKRDLTKTTSDGGFSIIDYPDLAKFIEIQAISSYFEGKYSGSTGEREYLEDQILGLDSIVLNDFLGGELTTTTDGGSKTKANSFFYESTSDKTLTLNGELDVLFTTLDFQIITVRVNIQRYDLAGTQLSETTVSTYVKEVGGPLSGKLTWSEEFTIDEGDSLSCTVEIAGRVEDKINWYNVIFNVTEKIDRVGLSLREGMPIYEAIERCLQLMVDKQYPLYSPKFGRTDTPYNFDGDTYATEDQTSFSTLISGLGLRHVDLDDENNALGISFDELFQFLQSSYNVGMSEELFEGEKRFVIDDYEKFFLDTEIFDFRNRLNKLDITRKIDETLLYNSIKTGQESYDYEELNGRGEYNTEQTRSTILNIDNQFNNISSVRGDVMGIIEKLELDTTLGSGTTDSEGDSDIFVIKSQRHPITANRWVSESDENIEVLDDSSLFEDNNLNLYFTPVRKLIRTSCRWGIGLIKSVSSYCRFQFSDKLQTLKTSGEGYEITENEDIQIGDARINSPKYEPIILDFDVEFTFEDLQTLTATEQTKYGYIRVTDEWSGYIMKFTKKNTQDLAHFTLILKHVN